MSPPQPVVFPASARMLLGVKLFVDAAPQDILSHFDGAPEATVLEEDWPTARTYLVKVSPEWIFHPSTRQRPDIPMGLGSPFCRRIFGFDKSTPKYKMVEHFLQYGIEVMENDIHRPNNHCYVCFADVRDVAQASCTMLHDFPIFSVVPAVEYHLRLNPLQVYMKEQRVTGPTNKKCKPLKHVAEYSQIKEDLAVKEAGLKLWLSKECKKMETAGTGFAYTSIKQAQQALSDLERRAPTLRNDLAVKSTELQTLQQRVKDIELGYSSSVGIAEEEEAAAARVPKRQQASSTEDSTLESAISTLQGALTKQLAMLQQRLLSTQEEFEQHSKLVSQWFRDTSKTIQDGIPTPSTFVNVDFYGFKPTMDEFARTYIELEEAIELKEKEVHSIQNRITKLGGTPNSDTIAAFKTAKRLLEQALLQTGDAHRLILKEKIESLQARSITAAPAPSPPTTAPGTTARAPHQPPPPARTAATLPGTTAAAKITAPAHDPPGHSSPSVPSSHPHAHRHHHHHHHHHHVTSTTPLTSTTTKQSGGSAESP
ncbi:hypothetical protein Pelo_3027 [Pelomyxa schiedti]|nr:hypothetical protein Pelo_3027 [Pelomyxa schiedti]